MSNMGNNFFWAFGCCEDRNDPEQLGRIRVRWLGIHSENKQDILTKDLPWSQVMQPGTGNNIAGVGQSTNIPEGSWVMGYAKDSGLQDFVILGVLPGMNTRTSVRGMPNQETMTEKFLRPDGKAWAQNRGDLKEITDDTIDYEKGFFDPTIDMRNIPYPPSAASYGNPVAGHEYDPPVDAPGDITPNNPDDKITRVPNYSDAGGGDHPSKLDLDEKDEAQWEYIDRVSEPMMRATHSDMLHFLYRTTRRLTADRRFKPAWIDFGTFRWPDNNTYYEPKYDREPEGVTEGRYKWGGFHDKDLGREGVIFSTGYLEPNYWSEDREYASTGGTYGPAFPVTRDTPAYIPPEEAKLLDIFPNDTRAGWGKESGEEVGYWSLAGEDFRVPNPRVRWVRKTHLTPTERTAVKILFDGGHYGTGTYNISKPGDGRQDIKWNDVKEDDLVVVPTHDTNTLARGGIPIQFTDGQNVTTNSRLWDDGTTYFAETKLAKGEPSKPHLQTGDIVQIAGVRGMQEVNGRIFRLLECSDNGESFSMILGTMDGKVWSGPGKILWKHIDDQLGEYELEAVAVDNANWSEYLGGGVVIPHNPHWSLCWKADMRERQINIGSPDPETGLNAMHWNQPTGDYNARYPYNNVYESESGHIMEYDDTPGAERIHQMHRSGTHYEIDHNGTKTNYVKGDNYDIKLHDDYVYVKGKVVHTYDDEVMIRYNDRAEISANWKLQLWSGGDLDIHSKRNINFKADGDINMQADGHINLHGTGVTGKTTDKYRAGSRNAMERSKIKLKAGHIEIEAVGNEALPKEYGVFIQSDQAPIGLKTLTGGDAGNIHIAAAHNMDLTAWNNSYRSTREGHIEDTAFGSLYSNSQTGSTEISASAGLVNITAKWDLSLLACAGSLRGDAGMLVYIQKGSMPMPASVGRYAYVPETMELLSIDLPNPRPAVGTSVTGLALNENNLELGIGGENIRNLHDTIENMQLGLSAYTTKMLPATDAMKEYLPDQSAMVHTGGHTFDLESPWNGYENKAFTIMPLGPEIDRPPPPMKAC